VVDMAAQGLGPCCRAQRARSRRSRARKSLEGVLSLGKPVIPPEGGLTWLGDPHPDLLFIPGEVEADRSTITLLVYMAHRLELKARLEMTWPVQARTARA
jgi:hypothetical protein